jgi:PLD-like domain
MSTNLIVEGIWKHIRSFVKKCPGRCIIAVAYFGSGAAKKLPLKAGSTLVVNMSDNAVKTGLTNPTEILKLVRRGVEVHSVENLHAKVFVIGNMAIIGSSNASERSANYLIEACVETSIPSIVTECRRFIRSLEGELVTPEYAKNKATIYRPPRLSGAKIARPNLGRRVVPTHSPLWVVPLNEIDWEDNDYAQEEIGKPKAKK